MKKETLNKIAIASVLCVPSCGTEYGVIIDKQDLSEEKALYVNLIKRNKSKQKPLHIQTDELFDADRKLFFMDSAYFDVFDYAMPGDTISFRNVSHKTYLDMELNKHNVRKINGVRESEIVKMVQSKLEHQK